MAYNGWILAQQSKRALLERFPPRFVDVIAHHVTLKMGETVHPERVSAKVVGYACNEAGIEALVVEINGSTTRHDGKTFHITWSIDREAGFKPVASNTLLETGFSAVDPIDIEVSPFFVENNGTEHVLAADRGQLSAMVAEIEAENAAIQRCLESGLIDPYFIGTKGYPNWHDFTDEAIARIRAFVADTQQLFIKREV